MPEPHLDSFRKMPVGDQEDVLALLSKALLWRSWDERGQERAGARFHAVSLVKQIGDIYHRNGLDPGEYT